MDVGDNHQTSPHKEREIFSHLTLLQIRDSHSPFLTLETDIQR